MWLSEGAMASREALRRGVAAEREFWASRGGSAGGERANTLTSNQQVRRERGEHYDGACGACVARKRWCGFAHRAKQFSRKSARARRELAENDEFVRAQKRVLVGRLEPSAKVAFFKLCARLEKHFARQPLNAARDPRRHLVLENGVKTVSREEIARIFEVAGVVLEDVELAVLLPSLRPGTQKKRIMRVPREEVLRMFCATNAYPIETNRFMIQVNGLPSHTSVKS